MKHLIFEEAPRYKAALLIKAGALKPSEMLANYVNSLVNSGNQASDFIGFSLEHPANGKFNVAFAKAYLDNLLPALHGLGVTHLYVADAGYFKILTKMAKAEPHYGYVLPCKIKGYEHLSIVLGVNYQQLVYNPAMEAKLEMSVQTLSESLGGTYEALGHNIIHSEFYPKSVVEIADALDSLHKYPELSADIEAFSLRHNEAGIGSIGFAWDQHNGIAFCVDYLPIAGATSAPYGTRVDNQAVKALLLKFLMTYRGTIKWHNASYDLRSIIYALFMKNGLDQKGLMLGLDTLTRKVHDTKVITYLATNSTAGNQLGLKTQAHEFAGNWAVEEITNILAIPVDDLLRYNLVDCLSTNYVFNKHYPTMVKDNQLDLYNNLMMPSLKVIIQMELTGMPMNLEMVLEAESELTKLQDGYLEYLQSCKTIKVLNLFIQREKMEAANAKLKTKQHPIEKFADEVFNPNSNPQLQHLLYTQIGFPVIDLTDSKQPATGRKTLKKLLDHSLCKNPEYKQILQTLIDYSGVTKILSAFIPSFKEALDKGDGCVWLHGGFNLGGTVSGRLSSSKPNMQQIPSGSIYGKLIKKCFSAPKGWIFGGADFNSLEDYISALTTKDPNKLKVYLDGFDGHCLRAAYYFRDQLPHIDLTDPQSVNTIKKDHEGLRQDSKAPTFLLTYGGTYHGMIKNLGWSEEMSKRIEANYHELYKVSDEYIAKRLEQASKDGYVDVAFGLRVRTPLLGKVLWGTNKVPYEAQAEGRTAGNAMGQSYGLLNNRAAVAFMERVWASPYRHDILPVALIHDAIYLLIRDDVRIVQWANQALIEEMRWQELPEIQHDKVKLGAALDLFYPTWADPITLNNDDTAEGIRLTVTEALAKREKAAAEKLKKAA